jgi:hypothetical protein
MTDRPAKGRSDDPERGLIPRADAMARARSLRPKAAGGGAGDQSPEGLSAGSMGAVGMTNDLHTLLCALAAYLGDRPNRDADAMALYGRVMRMLGEGGE